MEDIYREPPPRHSALELSSFTKMHRRGVTFVFRTSLFNFSADAPSLINSLAISKGIHYMENMDILDIWCYEDFHDR